MPIYEYQCKECGRVYEGYAEIKDSSEPITCKCGSKADRAILTAPCLVSNKTWSAGSFHPHYDEQLGQHFNSMVEKETYLAKKGLTQTEGSPSPETEQKSRPKMSKSQAIDLDRSAVKHNTLSEK